MLVIGAVTSAVFPTHTLVTVEALDHRIRSCLETQLNDIETTTTAVCPVTQPMGKQKMSRGGASWLAWTKLSDY